MKQKDLFLTMSTRRPHIENAVPWQGFNFSWQADQIRQLTRRFNITYIGIDTTGIGKGVYDLVSKFAPREGNAILYSVESKNRLAMKMIDVVERKRIEWAKVAIDETNKERVEILASFMAIRRTTTNSGNALTASMVAYCMSGATWLPVAISAAADA
jgi:hypothetical protein